MCSLCWSVFTVVGPCMRCVACTHMHNCNACAAGVVMQQIDVVLCVHTAWLSNHKLRAGMRACMTPPPPSRPAVHWAIYMALSGLR